MESVRLLLALAAVKGKDVHHLDVKSAFLNGDLAETVFWALSSWEQSTKCCSCGCGRTYTGCKLKGCGTPISTPQGKFELIVGVYVDDLIMTGTHAVDIADFNQEMVDCFYLSDLGPLSYYLGIEVTQGSREMRLGQRAYAEKLLEHKGMARCNCASRVPHP
jgi:hypothetical protein